MLRDVPRLYFMIFGIVAIIVLLSVWYLNMFQRESDILVLNEAIITAAVSEVDESARIDPGVMLLAPTFESVAWEAIAEEYPPGSKVQFDYMFDSEIERFSTMLGDPSLCSGGQCTSQSVEYTIGGDASETPKSVSDTRMAGLPIKFIRVKVNDVTDNFDVWTYVSTVKVDAISRED